MKIKAAFILTVFTLILSIVVSAYYLFFFDISEHRYNKIMNYYIARRVTDGLNTFNDKITALRDFVHENVHPIDGYYNRLDTVAIEKLMSGIGWCDQQARVFMQLARGVGITTRLLFLQDRLGRSPHSVVEALAPDNRWVIVDPANKLDLINKEGEFASQDDIREDLTIVSNNRRVKLMARFSKVWADNDYLSMYANPPSYIVTKKGNMFDFLRPIPISWLKPVVNIIQNRYLEQSRSNTKDIYEFKILKARGYHLLGYYETAAIFYDEIIKGTINLWLRRTAEYYYALLCKDRKKYNEAYDYLTEIIHANSNKLAKKIIERTASLRLRRKAKYHYALLRKEPKKNKKAYKYLRRIIDSSKNNPYLTYLYGLRVIILEKLDRDNEAEKDLLKIGYSLDAS